MLPVFWKQFTRDGKGDVRAEVGHDAETLEYIWQKYGKHYILFSMFIFAFVN